MKYPPEHEHELKTWPPYFEDVASGRKTVEVRHGYDRVFDVGQRLWLREWCPVDEHYSGRSIVVEVTHILVGGQFGIEAGHVAMSIRRRGDVMFFSRCEENGKEQGDEEA